MVTSVPALLRQKNLQPQGSCFLTIEEVQQPNPVATHLLVKMNAKSTSPVLEGFHTAHRLVMGLRTRGRCLVLYHVSLHQ
jgi:hypothetical protein